MEPSSLYNALVDGGAVTLNLTQPLFATDIDESDGIRQQELLPEIHYRRRPSQLFNLQNASDQSQAHIKNYHAKLRQHAPSISLYSFKDACVFSQGCVGTSSGRLIYDSVAPQINQGLMPDGLIKIGDGEFQLSGSSRTVGGTALLIKSTYDRNYGHWLFQGAAWLALMSDYIRIYMPTLIIPSGGSPRLLEFQNSLLSAFGHNAPVREHSNGDIFVVEKLLFVSPLHGAPLTKRPETLNFLRSFCLEKAYRDIGQMAKFSLKKRRLYLARRSYRDRLIANLEEIEIILNRFGFEEFFSEEHSHDQQIRAFAESEIVFGVKGAAFSNILFCYPNCLTIVLSPPEWPDPFFWDIAGQLGLEYIEILGVPERSVSYSYDPVTIEDILARF